MANQAFDYDLLISVGEAEKRIAQFAKTIERELGSSVEKAFKGSFDFDISPIQRKIKEIESQVKTLGQTFKGSFDFDLGPVNKQLDFTITKAQQLADAVGGNAANAPWMRMQRRMEQVTRLSEELRSNFTDPFSMTAINQLESKLRAISEDLKGKKTGSFSEAREWDKAVASAREEFDRGAPARSAQFQREMDDKLQRLNQFWDFQFEAQQKEDAQAQLNHNKRMRELQREQSAKEAAAKADYQERVSQSQTDITSADERRIANQARITKVFEAEFKRREQLDLEIENRVNNIKNKNLKDQADLVKKNAADKLKAEQDYLQAVADGQNRIRGEELQEAESQKKRLEDRKRYTEKFLESGKVGTEKQVQANDRMHERLLRGIQNLSEADARRYTGLTHFETMIGEVHQKYEAEAKQLILERDALGEREFNNRMQQLKMLHSADREFAQRAATNATNQDLAKFAGGGRAVSNMFQVQQAFEDYQYAGLRGAANNIAMMAANLGGPAGIVALVGIMGAQAAQSLGVWEALNESLGGFLWKTKAVTEEQEKQNRLGKANIDSWKDSANQVTNFGVDEYKGLEKQATIEKARIDTLVSINSQLMVAKTAYEGMEASAKILEQYMPSGWTGRFSSSPEESAGQTGKYREQIANAWWQSKDAVDMAKDSLNSFESAQRAYTENSGGLSLTAAGYEAIKKAIEENEQELVKLNSSWKTTLFLIKEMKPAAESLKNMMSDEWKKDNFFSSENMKGDVKRRFDEKIDSRQSVVDELQEELKIRLEIATIALSAELSEARRLGNTAREKEILKEINRLYEEKEKQIRKATEDALFDAAGMQKTAEAEMARLQVVEDTQKRIANVIKEEESSTERMLNHTKSLIQADRERLQTLENQVSAMEDQHGKQAVDLEAKHINHAAKLEIEAYDEKAKRGKEAYLKQVEWQKEIDRQRYEWLKRHNQKGKGDANPDVALTEAYNQYKAQRDAEVKAHIQSFDQIDEAYKKSIKRKAELQEKAIFKEYDDAQRAKLKGLQDDVSRYEGQGDLAKAAEARKQMAKLLQELSAAQQKMVGQGTKEESRQAADEVKKLNQMMIENAHQEEAIIKKRMELNGDLAARQLEALEEIKAKAVEAAAVDVINPNALNTLNAIEAGLERIKASIKEIPAIQLQTSGKAGPTSGGTPAYAEGTDYVPETGLALIHKGEMIIPASEAQKMRDAKSQQFSGSDEYNVKSARYKHSQQYLKVQNIFDSTKSSLMTQRNSGNVDAGRGLVEFRLEVEKGLSILKEAGKEIRKYEEAIQKQASERRKMSEKARHDAAMADIRERSSKSKLDVAESARRIRKLEEERQANLDRLNAGPESTPDYIKRRRKEINDSQWLDKYDASKQRWKDLRKLPGYSTGVGKDMPDGSSRSWEDYGKPLTDRRWHKYEDGSPAAAARDLALNIEQLESDYEELQSRIVDEIEKTHKMVNETKEKVTDAGHEREKMHQNKKAGLDLENQGWKQKHSGGEGGSFRTGDGEYISPETQQVEARIAEEESLKARLKRARALSGQTPQQNEAAEVQRAMQVEQRLQSSAQQKAILERLQAVKASEVGEATALASALERAAAAKAALASTGSGGYGATGAGVSGGRSGGAGGGGPSTVINNNMTGVMNNASPQAVFAAMQTAAQISSIRRS